jgi:uncharacterized membrane protein
MNRLAVLTFPNQTKIDEAIRALRKLHSGPGIKLYASAVVTKNADGKLKVQEITKEGHGGIAVGALIGALAGLPAGPAASAIIAAGGAVIGNAADLIAQDDFKEFANNIADNVVPGGAAIVADVAEDNLVAFKAMMQAVGGGVLTSACNNPQTNSPVVKET